MGRAGRIVGRIALVALPLALGAALLVRAAGDREPPALRERPELATAVRVLTLAPISFRPEVSAFGSVAPAATWRALAQAAGEIVWMHPDLRPGRLLDANVEIVRIDAADYELAAAQAEARLAGASARLAELETQESNYKASLAIEERALELAEADLERRRTLLQRDAISQAAVDQAETTVLQGRTRAQELRNRIGLVPAQRRVQEAETAIAESQLAEARRNIARTSVRMPFDGRIAQVDIERAQFVTNGQLMLVAEDIAEAEVSARLRLDQLEPLIADQIELASIVDLPASDIDALPRGLDLEAELRLTLGERVVAWPATVRRVSFALEPETRTIGFVVGVDDPIRTAIPGERPPLVRDMFVEVVLRGAPRPDALIVPREALERAGDGGWFVHVADRQDRLRRRDVTLAGLFGNVALVAKGLSPGERVVVGELAVAIEGMLLAPREDETTARRLDSRQAEARP